MTRIRTLRTLNYSYATIVLLLVSVFFVSSCGEDIRTPDGYSIHGIDLSHHQGEIHWESIPKDSVHFIFLKATEGSDYTDPQFLYNCTNSNANGFSTGAYHYFLPGVAPDIQAQHYVNTMRLCPPDLPLVIDFEVTEGVTKKDLIKNLQMCLTETERLSGCKPIIYTNLKLYYKYLLGNFDEYDYWIARYEAKTPWLAATKQWVFWQYDNKGKIKGIEGNVDLNVFRGDSVELKHLIDTICTLEPM